MRKNGLYNLAAPGPHLTRNQAFGHDQNLPKTESLLSAGGFFVFQEVRAPNDIPIH